LCQNPDIQGFVEEYSTLISETKKVCSNIHVTSVAPRNDQQTHVYTLEANELLKATCDSLACDFINLDVLFVLNNGEINDGYFASDNVHLTLKGSLKLAHLLPAKLITDKNVVQHKIAYNTTTVNKPASVPEKSVASTEPRLFNGPGDILSNLAPCQLRAQSMTFCSLEQLYNYRKARICKAEHLIPEIMGNTNCWTIMKVAKQIPVTERFETIKFDIMADCLQTKLEQSQQYRDELLSTGSRRIIENTHNQVWGRGDPVKYDGLNMLGQLHEIKRRALVSGKHSRSMTYKYCKTTKHMRNPPQASPAPVPEPRPQQVPEWRHVPEQSRRYPPAGMPPSGPANQRGPPARAPTTALAHQRVRRPAPPGEPINTYNRYAPLFSGERPYHKPVGSRPTYNKFAPLDPNEWPAAHKSALYNENEMSDHFYDDDDVLYHGY